MPIIGLHGMVTLSAPNAHICSIKAERLSVMLVEQQQTHEKELKELFDALKTGDSRGARARGVTLEMVRVSCRFN